MYKIESTKNYYFILRYCYSNDKDLIEKFHVVAGTGLINCINKTIEDFKDMHESFKFYTIKKDESLFGYFGTEFINDTNFLTSFFIMPEFRNKEDSKEFWNIIFNHFDNKPFITGIYSNNTRASKWLEKNGGVLLGEGLGGKAYGFLGA